jgi:DNA-directed RNA polymerase subunit E'/Rpb7
MQGHVFCKFLYLRSLVQKYAVAQSIHRVLVASQELAMPPKVVLSEKSMQVMEARIPELAGHAVHRAYYQALTTSGKVLEAVDGILVETTAEGERKVIRKLTAPTQVVPGSKRVRVRCV